MFNKKKATIGFVFFFLFIIIIGFASAVKPSITVEVGNSGLIVAPTEKSAIRANIDHEFEVHVFNVSNGMPITSGITCYMHLYSDAGNHLLEMEDSTPSHIFDYAFNVGGGNFTDLGEYQAKFQCNSSTLGGGREIFFIVNNFGEELDTAHSFKFNSAMFFMLILFLMVIVGMVSTEHYIGKFAFYWVAHILFIAGTFCMWQFNFGYTTTFLGMASIWKIMFYVSTIAMFPMLLASMAWIFYIHTYNQHFENAMRKGGNTEDAFRMADRKSKGWYNGKK